MRGYRDQAEHLLYIVNLDMVTLFSRETGENRFFSIFVYVFLLSEASYETPAALRASGQCLALVTAIATFGTIWLWRSTLVKIEGWRQNCRENRKKWHVWLVPKPRGYWIWASCSIIQLSTRLYVSIHSRGPPSHFLGTIEIAKWGERWKWWFFDIFDNSNPYSSITQVAFALCLRSQ